jgi:hypothetical protein
MPDPRYDGNEDLRVPKIVGYYELEHISKISGGTSESDFITSTNATEKFLKFYFSYSPTSSTCRGMYLLLRFTGAGTAAGEALRVRTETTAALTSGTLAGAHITAARMTGGTQSGLTVGVRATYEAIAATATLTGTNAALQCDSYLGAGLTADGTLSSFIRFSDSGTISMPYAFNFNGVTAATTAALEVDSGAVGTVYGYIRVLTDTNTLGYIPIYSSHS